jgi:hypothetical protein
MQQAETRAAFDVVRTTGIPHLAEQFDRLWSSVGRTEIDLSLLFSLKVLGLYVAPQLIVRLVAAAERPVAPEDRLWETVFRTLEPPHPLAARVVEALGSRIPPGWAGLGYLMLSNALARSGQLDVHPFDTATGIERLASVINVTDRARRAEPLAAGEALEFLRDPERATLIGRAADHPDPGVRLGAAWAGAKLGSEAAMQLLGRLTREVSVTIAARLYLQELDRYDLIPAQVKTPEFEAKGKLAEWLAHPDEFGRPPDELEVFDTRELAWAPTNDTRRVWLIRFRYEDEGESPGSTGVGMVGSITYALGPEETSAQMSPEDLYGLHCCWELQADGDPRAPRLRTAEAGRRLLGI